MPEPELVCREISIPVTAQGIPVSLNEEQRSVEVVCASETPVRERDQTDYQVKSTVLLMLGCQVPETRQLPLLNNHSRRDASAVIGSVRNLRVEGGRLVGTAFFSSSPDVEPVWQRVREGHLTDLSVGRIDDVAETIPAGTVRTLAGRQFAGPVRIVTRWSPREVSVTPIGADQTTKTRSRPHNREEQTMQKEEQTAAESVASTDSKQVETTTVQRAADPEARPETRQESALSFADGVAAVQRCAKLGISGADREAVLAGVRTRAEVDARILAHLERQSAALPDAAAMPAPASPGLVQRGLDERDKERAAITDALLVRSGCLGKGQQPAEGAAEFASYSLMEIARRCLRTANQPQGGTEMELVGRAFLYSDLKHILDNVSGKIFEAGFAAIPSRWQEWCSVGSVPDFRLQTLVTVGGLSDLDKIVDDVGYQYGRLKDEGWTFRLDTWGKLYAIYRRMIVNNEWGLIEEMNRLMGETAARKLGDLPYDLLTANPTTRDGSPLFDANHNNAIGNVATVDTALFTQALRLAGLQRDFSTGRALGIRLQYILAPLSLEGVLEGFFATNQFVENAGATSRANIYAGQRFTRIYDARLDDADPKTFYMAAENRTVRMFFLNGRQDPYIETREGWTVDGVEYKVRIDACAVPLSYQTMVKITMQ